MSRELTLALIAVVVGASGTYLLLPHKHGATKPKTARYAGSALAALGLLLFAYFWSPPGPVVSRAFFYAFAFGSVAGAVLTVTARNPVHSALWFAAVVLSTSGLFVQAGASFLAAGTVIVYAGAIIVTFLFVIMLAQMEGRAAYDRAARMPFRATWICFLLLFGVIWSLFHQADRDDPTGIFGAPARATIVLSDSKGPKVLSDDSRPRPRPGSERSVGAVLERSVRPTARLRHVDGRAKLHVAGLGETLYTDHLVTVELAGALLFVALVGALAIAAPKPPVRPSTLSKFSAGADAAGEARAATSTPLTANVQVP